MEEADAILTCETESRIVPAKVPVKVIEAQVRLVDRHSQKLIWNTKKSTYPPQRLRSDGHAAPQARVGRLNGKHASALRASVPRFGVFET
jgi:hypothetical protein